MSCYFRHIKDVFAEAEIEVTPANKKEVDRAIHRMVGLEYKNCPVAWKKLKQDFLAGDKGRAELIRTFKRLASKNRKKTSA